MEIFTASVSRNTGQAGWWWMLLLGELVCVSRSLCLHLLDVPGQSGSLWSVRGAPDDVCHRFISLLQRRGEFFFDDWTFGREASVLQEAGNLVSLRRSLTFMAELRRASLMLQLGVKLNTVSCSVERWCRCCQRQLVLFLSQVETTGPKWQINVNKQLKYMERISDWIYINEIKHECSWKSEVTASLALLFLLAQNAKM